MSPFSISSLEMLLSGPGQLSIEISLGSMVINHEEAPEKISVGFSVGTSSNGRIFGRIVGFSVGL